MDRRVLLIILDGFGFSERHEHNAVFLAKKPHLDDLMERHPHSLLECSGHAVGLPDGIMGNSEVGHLNIGGGRVIKQELTKIADFAKTKGFESLPDVKRVFSEGTGALHIFGLLSDGGVHSDQEHLFLLLEAAARCNVKKPIYIHVIGDGRDTPPQSLKKYLSDLEKSMAKNGQGSIATVMGRFYIMDRDKRWERVQEAYTSLTKDDGHTFDSAQKAVDDAYSKGETDEFIKPRQIKGGSRVKNGDSVIFFNFRADRAREISTALALQDFKEFATPVKIESKNYVTFTRYDEKFPFPILFKPDHYKKILAELISARGEKQLRIAETEKYAHVTYFFNGGEETQFPNEERVLIPSPKEVKTYDQKPEMSARLVTNQLLVKMSAKKYRLIVLNFANSDMVGHTGNEKAAIEAVEVLDECLGRICAEAQAQSYDVLITADHGNSECMVDPITKAPHTAHTTNPVPLLWISPRSEGRRLNDGILADIAPTILEIFGWEKPAEMTGKSLLV